MHVRSSLCALVAGVVAAGCGAGAAVAPEVSPRSQAPRAIDDVRHGYSLTLPAGWHRAPRNLTPELTEPREILSIATYPLRYERRARCAIGGCPTPALNGFRAADVLVSIQERRQARPARKDVAIDLERRQTASEPGQPPCVRTRVAWYAFEEFAQAGRTFYVLAIVGRRASAQAREELNQVLGSLRFGTTSR